MQKGLRWGFLTLVTAFGATAATHWDAAGKAWWSHVQFLADDKREGRSIGSAGFDAAANYVVDQFERAGLQAGAHSSYSQPVSFNKFALNEAGSSLAIQQRSGAVKATLGDEAFITSIVNGVDVDAPLVFAGYGLDIPEANYSDLKSPALKGAVIVYLGGGPADISTELRSHHSAGAERARALKAAGVIGSISIPNPKSMDIPWERQSANRLIPRMILADPVFAEKNTIDFTSTWNPAKADILFAGSGHTIAEILDAADHNKPLPHFETGNRVKAHVAVAQEKVESRNIVGIREGSDHLLKKEFIILSAHLDHLGTNENKTGDSVFNGAMDDASGVASLIEIAQALKNGHVKTKRSVAFVAVTGEEKGLLGSQFYAQYPTVPGRIVADINMDMFLPLYPLKYLEVQGLNESTLGDDIRVAAKTLGVEIQADKDPNANRFIRSDQYSFIRKGVPALAFKFGWLPGSNEEKIFKDWYRDRYHALGDDLTQPVDTKAAAQFDAILTRLLERVADADGAPQWKPDSPFRQYVKEPQAQAR